MFVFKSRALELVVAFAAFAATPVLAQGPASACPPYYDPASGPYVHTNFPTVWQPATLLANDSAGQAMWNKIAGSIPNIAPKGQVNGSTINVTYNTAADSDCWFTLTHCTTPKVSGIPTDVGNVPEPRTMGYGFDDGPNCTHNAFYDYLSSQNQKATMFFIGSNVLNWPNEARRALADGHEICAHSWSHRYMTAFDSQDAFAEFWYTLQAIKLVMGITVTCWRPPFGDVDDRIRAIANALGLRTVVWGYDSNDWRVGTGNITEADVDNAYNLFISNLTAGTFNTAGGIMLTHELNNYTMSEAIKYYPQLKSSFSYLAPVGVCLNKTQPYVETNYSLPSFSQYIAGQITTSGNSSGSGTSGANSSPTSSSSKKKSSASSVTVSYGTWWTLLSAANLLFSLML